MAHRTPTFELETRTTVETLSNKLIDTNYREHLKFYGAFQELNLSATT